MITNSTNDKINEIINEYDLKNFGSYENPIRTADYIYMEDFKTGDILYYNK